MSKKCKQPDITQAAVQAAYQAYKLCSFQKYVHIMILVIALFNLLLLVPDLILTDDLVHRTSIVLLRAFFSLFLLAIAWVIRRVKTLYIFSILVTICELVGVIIFLLVFTLYDRPDFLIQTLGMITIILIFFLLPNQWEYKLLAAVPGAIGFFLCAALFLEHVDTMQYGASVTYMAAIILLSALSARNREKHQRGEFISKHRLERLSSTDYLTNAANRYKMEEEADRWLKFCHRQNLPLALVFIDVDDLKAVNDRHGHSGGDALLVNLAGIIRSQSRETDILARWGGDEFLLLLPNITLENAGRLCRRIQKAIEDTPLVSDMPVTCSFGVVPMKESSTFGSLVQEADALMYTGKNTGKNTVQIGL
ncbi:MAG: GGDEF domain-containing protein [Eubacteriales bacterium]|nr:GGDEF domain-containing protein [Eubacteriales bacterium]